MNKFCLRIMLKQSTANFINLKNPINNNIMQTFFDPSSLFTRVNIYVFIYADTF